MKDGFVKAAAGTPEIRVADCAYNTTAILDMIRSAETLGVKLLALPELCVTGYTCADLFFQHTLTESAEAALSAILSETAGTDMLFALGLPVSFSGKLYNCAAVCCRGRLLALVPKTFLPNYGEFYERRWFAEGRREPRPIRFAGQDTLIGTELVFPCERVPGLCVGVEICEDLWVPEPPSTRLALAGSTVILNLSASNALASKDAYRRALVTGQSGRLMCGYIYADAGEGESTTDLVFAGHNLIAENGLLLEESRFETGLVVSELDVDYLILERTRISTFPPDRGPQPGHVPFALRPEETALTRPVSPTPFVPHGRAERSARCEEIFRIAALGLKKRLAHTAAKTAVIGVSGGLDSTLALLITARAFDLLGLPRGNIVAVSMPGFGTTARTKSNAGLLAGELHAALRTIDITKAVRQHFADIGHDARVLDVVFENTQARERTQVLMDLANALGGLVIGTGDMSELALGWATYNGDHMSMYGVNSGIPKTLVRYLVEYCADIAESQALSAVLRDILATPVSPELLPAENGDISQRTEELVGPYELHDFFLYHMIRRGCGPKKVLRLAEYAFGGAYGRETLIAWLRIFIRRFFAQQYKRSCLPDGPKVGTLSLSPRGDLRMPSDAVCDAWLAQLETLGGDA
ncbi:MAG: NAD(+) synthase [Oscillospiraceae bacterium]|jgi:NAD+ synthase (glutamine-hydrolysing)|nr:NAD(+) synthase [Oscillospiraceae bacterium]